MTGRCSPRPPAGTGVVVVPLLALVLWLLYGSGYVDYDAIYALIWGRDLAGGHRPPDLEWAHSPTSHPLSTGLSLALAAFPASTALDLLSVIAVLSLAALGWAAYRFGAAAHAPAAGALLAVLVLTRPLVVERGLIASIDVPFLALVCAALALEAREARRGWPVLAVLAVAGLLRPEAWLLALAYLLYLLPALPERSARVRLGALTLAAPALWLAFDLVLTSDPLHSLHGTRDAATRIGRPQGLGEAVRLAPNYLVDALGAPVALGGAAGAVLALAARGARRREWVAPIVVGALGGVSFLLLGVADLPLLARYLFVSAVMLAFCCAALATAWSIPALRERHRTLVVGAATLVFLGLVISVPSTVRDVDEVVGEAAMRHDLDRDLPALFATPAARRALERCPPIQVDYFQTRPLVALLIERRPEELRVARPSTARAGLLLLPRRGARGPAPASFEPVASNRSWVLYGRCAQAPAQ